MRKLATLTLAASLAGGVAAAGEMVKPQDVKFNDAAAVETSLTGTPGDPEKGAEVVGNKGLGNCVACHAISALSDVPFHGEVGPPLDGAGERWSEAELRGILVNSKVMFEGTVMPAYYKVDGFNRPGDGYTGKAAKGELDPLLSAQQIEDVVAFLSTLKYE